MFIKKTLSEHENVLLGKKVLSWVSSHDLYRGFARQPYWMAGQWKLFALERTFVPMRKRIYCSCHPIWLLCKTSIGKTGLASEKDLLPVGLIAQLVEVRVQNQSRPEIFRSCFLTTAIIMGSCVIKTSVDWHSQPICRPSTGRYVGWHIGRYSVDMPADCRSALGRHLGWYVAIDCRWCIGRLSVVSEYCSLLFC